MAESKNAGLRLEANPAYVLRATVNPRNNLAHCFCCGRNFNNIDLMIIQGYDFLPAVDILKGWLQDYQRDRHHVESSV